MIDRILVYAQEEDREVITVVFLRNFFLSLEITVSVSASGCVLVSDGARND